MKERKKQMGTFDYKVGIYTTDDPDSRSKFFEDVLEASDYYSQILETYISRNPDFTKIAIMKYNEKSKLYEDLACITENDLPKTKKYKQRPSGERIMIGYVYKLGQLTRRRKDFELLNAYSIKNNSFTLEIDYVSKNPVCVKDSLVQVTKII